MRQVNVAVVVPWFVGRPFLLNVKWPPGAQASVR
jgi:hypothetical protein